MAPKVEGVKNSKKKNHQMLQRLILEQSNFFIYARY
jgi:hypothetical protein